MLEMVEITASGCRNPLKYYAVFGDPELAAMPGAGEVEWDLPGWFLNRQVGTGMGTLGDMTFIFPKPATDRHFFQLREFALPPSERLVLP